MRTGFFTAGLGTSTGFGGATTAASGAFGSVPPTRAEDAPRWHLLRSQRFEDDEMAVYAPPG